MNISGIYNITLKSSSFGDKEATLELNFEGTNLIGKLILDGNSVECRDGFSDENKFSFKAKLKKFFGVVHISGEVVGDDLTAQAKIYLSESSQTTLGTVDIFGQRLKK